MMDGSSAPPSGPPFVTVIVPMYNERAHIRECLASLLEQDYPPASVEILVVDGLSRDGSREIVTEIARREGSPPGDTDRIRLLDNPRRIPAAALNLGVREARGEVILRLDAHARAARDFIRRTVEALARSGADCVGGPIESVGRGGPAGRAIALAMSSRFGVGNARFRYAQEEQYVDTVAFGAYPRRVLDEIGPYDEDLVYSEDNELNDRLRKRGGKILLAPAIRSFYYTRESLPALWRQYFRYGYGRARLMTRDPRSAQLRHVAPFGFVTVLGLTALLGFVSRLFWLVLLVLGGLYVASSFAASVAMVVRSGRGRSAGRRREPASPETNGNGLLTLLLLPAAFACQHLGYGVGMWAGFLTGVGRQGPRPGSS